MGGRAEAPRGCVRARESPHRVLQEGQPPWGGQQSFLCGAAPVASDRCLLQCTTEIWRGPASGPSPEGEKETRGLARFQNLLLVFSPAPAGAAAVSPGPTC